MPTLATHGYKFQHQILPLVIGRKEFTLNERFGSRIRYEPVTQLWLFRSGQVGTAFAIALSMLITAAGAAVWSSSVVTDANQISRTHVVLGRLDKLPLALGESVSASRGITQVRHLTLNNERQQPPRPARTADDSSGPPAASEDVAVEEPAYASR